MERTLSSEERIRRAEEIYYRRRAQDGIERRVQTTNTKSKEKNNYNLLKRMILQILICFFTYLIMYLIKNSNYIFSEDVINKTRELLSYDINFQNTYNYAIENYNNNIKPWLDENIFKEEIQQDENVENQIENDSEKIQTENIENQTGTDTPENQNEIGGIGGGTDDKIEVIEASADVEQEEVKELSQMEIDANEIKANYSFIVPLRGTITSRYGPRTPTEIVSANHAGIDIAANEGTVYVSAMEGTVTKVSDYGSYGTHIYIENGDVLTIYAHCKTIYVKEGSTVKQGEQIGEVGSTGNATGPHLHFEIRKSGRVVNPEYVLSFD